MNRHAFVLEIGTEEIPARFIAPALRQLAQNAANLLAEFRLVSGCVRTVGTPRRLALLLDGLSDRQEDMAERKKGPARKAAFDRNGFPAPAAIGFARSQNVAVDDLTVEDVDGISYVFAIRREQGKDTLTILPVFCERLIRSLSFPKPMFWHSRDIRFARPIRRLLALYGSTVVPFAFAGLEAANQTSGHRFLAPAAISLRNAEDYLSVMEKNFVMVDPADRSAKIADQVRAAAAAAGGECQIDEELLEEVVNLVEYPCAVAGEFSRDYLDIPKEVLITVMKAHQRYFPVLDKGGKLLPYFVTVSNGIKKEFLPNVKAGNERVLRARLADARFFFREDRKKSLEAYVLDLDNIIFMEPLGTMRQKTDRLSALALTLANEAGLSPEGMVTVQRAAYLAKGDLMTRLVYEFPELQGIMGGHYAELSGESPAVAAAIAEHYSPASAKDSPARTLPGAVVALADKLDTLAACFSLGLIPSGSQDPYALRRNALGVVATLLAHGLSLQLPRLVSLAFAGMPPSASRPAGEAAAEMEEFLWQRVRHVFAEKGMRYDIIEAVLAAENKALPDLLKRAELLRSKLDSPDLVRVLTPFARVANLTRNYRGYQIESALLSEPAEIDLFTAAAGARQKAEAASNDFEAVYAALTPLYAPIDRFFNEVLVMAENQAIRSNRLALLNTVKDLFFILGDLSKIVLEKK